MYNTLDKMIELCIFYVFYQLQKVTICIAFVVNCVKHREIYTQKKISIEIPLLG